MLWFLAPFHYLHDGAKKCFLVSVSLTHIIIMIAVYCIVVRGFLLKIVWVLDIAVTLGSMWFLRPQFRLSFQWKRRRRVPLRTRPPDARRLDEKLSWSTG